MQIRYEEGGGGGEEGQNTFLLFQISSYNKFVLQGAINRMLLVELKLIRNMDIINGDIIPPSRQKQLIGQHSPRTGARGHSEL